MVRRWSSRQRTSKLSKYVSERKKVRWGSEWRERTAVGKVSIKTSRENGCVLKNSGANVAASGFLCTRDRGRRARSPSLFKAVTSRKPRLEILIQKPRTYQHSETIQSICRTFSIQTPESDNKNPSAETEGEQRSHARAQTLSLSWRRTTEI
jgi:hypothetical protein